MRDNFSGPSEQKVSQFERQAAMWVVGIILKQCFSGDHFTTRKRLR